MLNNENSQFHNLILFGYKSSGKTFFGRILARQVKSLFIDTDRLIEEKYKIEFQEVLNYRQIFIKIGESQFRRFEKKIIDDLKKVNHAIIALGGGVVLDAENCLKLKKLGLLIYLEADKETIKRRIFRNGIPSFLDSTNPEKSFEKMYEERRQIYHNISPFKIQMHGKTNQQILNELKSFRAMIL